MKEAGLPLAFAAALARDKHAMQSFAKMSKEERDAILRRAHTAVSRADMQLIVLSLSDGMSAAEYH